MILLLLEIFNLEPKKNFLVYSWEVLFTWYYIISLHSLK